MPRSVAFLMVKSGNWAPRVAKGTFRPGRALAAPQTTCEIPSACPFTWHTRNFSAFGCGSVLIISPTMTPENLPAAGWAASTSNPAMVNWATNCSVVIPGLTHSLNQASLNFINSAAVHFLKGWWALKLPQKIQVVFKKQPQIIDAITQHRQTLHTHAERKTCVDIRIHTTGAEHIGMHHPATHHFQPAGLFTYPATLARTLGTLNVHFSRGFCKRKIRG